MTAATTPDLGRLRLLALVRIGWAISWIYAFRSKGSGDMVDRLPEDVWFPVSAAKVFESPPPVEFADLLHLLVVLSAVSLMVGLFTRLSAAVCFVTGVLFMSIGYSWGKIGHDTHVYMLLLLVLSFSDWGRVLSVDALTRRLRGRNLRADPTPWPDWPWWTCLFVFAFIYVNSGLHKIFKGHFLDGGFHQYLKYRLILSSRDSTSMAPWAVDAVTWVIERPEVVQFFAWTSLLFEAGFVVALLSRRIALVMLSSIWAFHGGIGVFSGVYFVSPMAASTILFITLLAIELRERFGWFLGTLPLKGDVEPDRNRISPWARTLLCMALTTILLLTVGLHIGWSGAAPVREWISGVLGGGRLLFTPDRYVYFFAIGLAAAAILAGWIAWDFLSVLLRPRGSTTTQDVLLYDRDCGFCLRWVEWARRRGADVRVRFEPCQSERELLADTELSEADCKRSAYFLEGESRSALAGASAINAVLLRLPGTRNACWRVAGHMGRLNGICHIEALGYWIIARFRHRLGSRACNVPEKA